MKIWYLVVLLLISCTSFAKDEIDVDVLPYIGVSQTDIEAYGVEGTTHGGVVGFWMDDRVALDLGYETDNDLSKYQVNLIGSIFHGYLQRLTWQIGYNYYDLSMPGEDFTKSFPSIGLGYEFQPFQALTLRAQYNYYHLSDDDFTDHPNGVSVAVLYNF